MEEEVWNDINLSSLHDRSSTADQSFRAAILQDYFSTPPSNSNKIDLKTTKDSSSFAEAIFLCSHSKRPPNCLSLNSESEFGLRCLETRPPVRPNLIAQTRTGLLTSFKSGLDSSLQNKKRAHDNGEDSGDRKNQRLMKSRESASRSRARKQAYTNELELEVAYLRRENARIKKQLTQFYMEAPPAQLPKKLSLCRTSTAPF